MDDAVQALIDVLALKQVDRAGWVRVGVDRPESVAAHAWGVTWLVLVLLPAGLDRERALVYAVLHDLAEAWTGDLTPHDGVPADQKHAREDAAMAALSARLQRPDLLATWRAYERQDDPEARFVRQLDRVDMALQARRYRADLGVPTDELLASADAFVDDPALRPLLDALRPDGPRR